MNIFPTSAPQLQSSYYQAMRPSAAYLALSTIREMSSLLKC